MEKTVDPIASQLPELLASLPRDTPIVMLNLLKFNEVAKYRDGQQECSGRQAYRRYAKVALQKGQEVGGSVVFMGAAKASIIGPGEECWHEVLLVRYPSAAAFELMRSMQDYRAATRHRTAALEDARLIATVEQIS